MKWILGLLFILFLTNAFAQLPPQNNPNAFEATVLAQQQAIMNRLNAQMDENKLVELLQENKAQIDAKTDSVITTMIIIVCGVSLLFYFLVFNKLRSLVKERDRIERETKRP